MSWRNCCSEFGSDLHGRAAQKRPGDLTCFNKVFVRSIPSFGSMLTHYSIARKAIFIRVS